MNNKLPAGAENPFSILQIAVMKDDCSLLQASAPQATPGALALHLSLE